MEFYDDMQEPYWLDEDYRQISEQYFSGMEAIESDWSVMYNLKDYEGERASIFIQNCTSYRAILYICPLNMNRYGDLISFL